MTYEEWLQQLKKGDVVVVSRSRGVECIDESVVTRITKARIFVQIRGDAEQAYHKHSGCSVGGGAIYGASLLQPTEALHEAVELARLKSKAFNILRGVVVPDTRAALLDFIGTISRFTPLTRSRS